MADQDNARVGPINTRSPAQWAVLNSVYDFEGKTVLDVGCGHGDLLFFAREAGAARIIGIDNNKHIIAAATYPLLPIDLEFYLKITSVRYDVVFCFSVLPYLKDVNRALRGLSRVADVAFIEAQLKGDGPGTFEDEDELRDKLLKYWPKVTRVGETLVKIRDCVRAIWMCEYAA